MSGIVEVGPLRAVATAPPPKPGPPVETEAAKIVAMLRGLRREAYDRILIRELRLLDKILEAIHRGDHKR